MARPPNPCPPGVRSSGDYDRITMYPIADTSKQREVKLKFTGDDGQFARYLPEPVRALVCEDAGDYYIAKADRPRLDEHYRGMVALLSPLFGPGQEEVKTLDLALRDEDFLSAIPGVKFEEFKERAAKFAGKPPEEPPELASRPSDFSDYIPIGTPIPDKLIAQIRAYNRIMFTGQAFLRNGANSYMVKADSDVIGPIVGMLTGVKNALDSAARNDAERLNVKRLERIIAEFEIAHRKAQELENKGEARTWAIIGSVLVVVVFGIPQIIHLWRGRALAGGAIMLASAAGSAEASEPPPIEGMRRHQEKTILDDLSESFWDVFGTGISEAH